MIYEKGYIITHEDSTKFLGSALTISPSIVGKKPYITMEGDTLFRIANTQFQDTRSWYDIALLNPDLPDPIVIPIGTTLFLPVYGKTSRS